MERLEGIHCVREALAAGRRRCHRLLVRAGRNARPVEALVEEAGRQGLPVERLESSARLPYQGVALVVDRLPELPLEQLLVAPAPVRRWLVALDGVEDPQNVGAVARVAEAAGCAGMILTRRHAPGLTPSVSRASAGAIEHLPVGRVANLPRALVALRDHGYWSVGADLGELPSLFDTDDRLWEGALVLVVGAEGRGLRRGVRDALDHRVRIPMWGHVASLNVSAAAAILLWEAARRSGSREAP